MTDFKQKLRGFFSDSSLFRRIYIIDLFFTNIAFLQIPAYVLLVFLFIWGVCLSVYNQRHNNTFFKLRFGIWIGAFLAVTVFTMLINFSQTFLYSLLMLLHVVMCFFLFYGMHTEPEFDYRIELYHIAKFILYATTIMNIIGITCLMFGFKFEWYWIKFTVYENRFTGCYVNPNLLGFISVVSFFCCHILSKGHFMRRIAEKISEPGKCVFAHSVRFKRLTCACSRICNCLYSLYVLCRQGGTFTFKNYFENYSAVSCGSFPYRLCLDVQNDLSGRLFRCCIKDNLCC